MMRRYTLLLLLLLLLVHSPSSTCSSVLPLCNHHDNSNLLQFKNSFAINTSLYLDQGCSYSKIASWENGTDCCEWDGITCDTTSGHVIGLNLMCGMLEGEFHPNSTLFHLTQLTQLVLSENRFHGEIPSLLSNLKHLTFLDLSSNTFSGHIPDVFDNFTELDSLALSSNNLGGQVPPSLFRLTQLSFLDLSSNKLGGQLPSSLLDLSQLSFLNLSAIQLINPIPSKNVTLSKLETLNLRNNFINGTIPDWCYSLFSLKTLDLSMNHLTGPINKFSTYSLKYLYLFDNKFQGDFPSSIFEFLNNLTELDMSSNDFNGFVDFSYFSKLENLNSLSLSNNKFLSIDSNSRMDYVLPQLEYLTFSSCSVTVFPSFLPRLQNLRRLDLSNNKIYGKIPNWFGDNLLYTWKSMDYIDLSFNRLQGDLPILPNGIYYFAVSNNNFTGSISSTICNASSSLGMLILSHNNLTGKIPQCLGSFSRLQVLDLQINNFYGSIPDNFSKSSNAFIETILLNGNHLEGPIPQSLAYCTALEILDLGDNNIEDVFPSWLQTLKGLQVLSLRDNKFHGTIPRFNIKHPFSKLKIFYVSNNKLSGPLPMSYFKEFQGMVNPNDNTQDGGSEYMSIGGYNDSVMVNMKDQVIELATILTIFTTIDMSNNLFEGEIPHVIGELYSLKGLNLSHNAITGTIPQSFGKLTNLEWLDLSWNQLTGEIPMTLTNLNFLSVLNLSQNQLEGIIPTEKQFNTFQNDSYGGNPMLCGPPLSKSCGNDEEQSSSIFQEEVESGSGWKPVAMGYACGMLFGMVLGTCFFLSGRPQWLARLVGIKNARVKRPNTRAQGNRRRRMN